MRISDDFRDYYDNMLYLFMDEVQPVYVRKSQSVDEKCPFELPVSYYSMRVTNGYKQAITQWGVIVFCGRGYPYIKVDTFADGQQTIVDGIIVFDQSQILSLAEEIEQDRIARFSIYSKGAAARFRKSYRELFDKIDNYNWLYLHIKHKSPVIMFYVHRPFGVISKPQHVCIKNPCLNDYNFVTVVNQYSAIQSIEMYLMNELATEQNPPQITNDKILAEKHGFGHRYAFKKEPEGIL